MSLYVKGINRSMAYNMQPGRVKMKKGGEDLLCPAFRPRLNCLSTPGLKIHSKMSLFSYKERKTHIKRFSNRLFYSTTPNKDGNYDLWRNRLGRPELSDLFY